MFNAQNPAVRIERILREHGYAKQGDADLIRRDPMGFMDAVLKRYEKVSEENDGKAADFWETYECHVGDRLDDFGEEMARSFAAEPGSTSS